MLAYRSKLSRIIVIALLTTIVNPIYCQEEQSWKSRVASSLYDATPGVLKSAGEGLKKLVQPTIDNLKSKVGETISSLATKLKSSGPKTIIPMLQDALKSLGSKIGTMSECMLGKGSCSSKERAAFIGAAVVVLALTAILIGYTVTVAATSKEVDTQVTQVSQEVQGWNAKAVFTRLNNTVNDFKANLESMKVCLINNQCTRNQKNLLYATAATIAALATIAVGVGVGSYIYAEKEKMNEKEAAKTLKDIENAPAPTTQTGASAEKTFIPSFTLPEFGTVLQGKLSQWQQKMQQQLPIVNTESLKEAYELIKKGVMTGYIDTKEKAGQLFTAAIGAATEKAEQFQALLKNTLGIDIEQLSESFKEFKENLNDLTTLISQGVRGQMAPFADKLEEVVQYFNSLTQRAKDAKEAWDQLSAGTLFEAKIMSPEKYRKEKEAFDRKYKEVTDKKEELALKLEQLTIAQSNPQTQVQKKRKISIFKQEESTTTDYENLKKGYEQELAKLAKEQDKLDLMNLKLVKMKYFDQFASYDKIKKLYPDIVKTINGLQLDMVGAFAEKLLGAIGKLLQISQTLHEKAGKIGAIIADPEIDQALVNLQAGITGLGKHIRNTITVQPLIVTNNLDLNELVTTVLNIFGKDFFTYMKDNGSTIKESVFSIKRLAALIAPIQVSLEVFTNRLKNIATTTKAEFIAKVKSNPLAGIAGAPTLLRDTLADAVKGAKVTFNNVLGDTTNLLTQASIAVPAVFQLLQDLNKRIETMTKKPFINPDVLTKAVPILTVDLPNIAEGAKGLIRSIQSTSVQLGS